MPTKHKSAHEGNQERNGIKARLFSPNYQGSFPTQGQESKQRMDPAMFRVCTIWGYKVENDVRFFRVYRKVFLGLKR